MLLSYITTESNGTLTLDQLLRGPLSLSAREVREAKRLGLTVDGAPFFANQRIGAGRTVAIPLAEYDMPTDFSAPAEVDILYQDDALIAVRKPAPLQVHPSPSAPRVRGRAGRARAKLSARRRAPRPSARRGDDGHRLICQTAVCAGAYPAADAGGYLSQGIPCAGLRRFA
ncbi:MAG: hypothetical protein ACLR4A_15855 [Christensenellales bacterium]